MLTTRLNARYNTRTATALLLYTVLSSLCGSAQSSEYSQKNLNEEIVIAGNWQQHAPEYDALLYQVFNIARQNLPAAIQKAPKDKKLAIVTDIDDTLIDGTAYFTSLQGTDQSRNTERSIRWWNTQTTHALPGAVSFFNDLYKQGIEVFYISGRFNEVKDATFNKLKKFGFPVFDKDHILLQGTTNTTLSKEGKRQSIRDKGYHILMVFGDQLSDLGEAPDNDYRLRRQWVIDNKAHFGNDWYLFPNTVYGAWEDSLAPGYSKMTPKEKHEYRLAALRDTRFNTLTDKDFAQQLTLASVWTHTSADFTALCYQAYNRAEQLINKMPAKRYNNPVIIADIDGTVLDFSTTPANLADTPEQTPAPNELQTEYQYSRPIPGAVEFLNSASQKGYEIFYVSSRLTAKTPDNKDADIENTTIKKLSDFHFPYADRQHVLLHEEYCSARHKQPCSNEVKRAAIQNGRVDTKKHDIVLMIGDLLLDFNLTEQQLDPRLKASAASAASQFGNDYILIPNPLNTVWMWQLYSREAEKQNKELSRMSREEQAKLRRSLIQDWPEKWPNANNVN